MGTDTLHNYWCNSRNAWSVSGRVCGIYEAKETTRTTRGRVMEKDFTDIYEWMIVRRRELENYEPPDHDEIRYVLICLELLEEVERLRNLLNPAQQWGEGDE